MIQYLQGGDPRKEILFEQSSKQMQIMMVWWSINKIISVLAEIYWYKKKQETSLVAKSNEKA